MAKNTRTKSRAARERSPMAKWLRSVRLAQDMDQAEFARFIGRGRSAVAMYERGSPIPAQVVAAVLSSFENAPPPPQPGELQVTGGVFSDNVYRLIKYAGVVPCSSEWGDPLASEENRPIDPKFAGKNRFLCKVVGDSCYPALLQGDHTVWEVDHNPPWGVIVLGERLEDAACTVKVLEYDPQRRHARLVPVNPDHDEPIAVEGWRVAARLVGVIRAQEGPERTWYWEPGLRPQHLLQ